MNRESVKLSIIRALNSAGISDADIRIQPDGAGAWKVAVISSDFEKKTNPERVLASGLADLDISWADLLTPSEAEWAGPLPANSEPDQAPLWAEALGRAGSDEQSPVFASDLDQDLPGPTITTFYSLRGGVGRSTALINTARILANRGRKVVVVDMDLEAPGLAALLGVETEVGLRRGAVELLTALDLGETEIDISKHLIRIGSEDLYCLPAGSPSADYARKLSLIDPAAWYREERNPLRGLFDLLRNDLPFTPDHILIDSRTGISPISGPLLFDVPDLAIIVFFPHPQAREGTRALTQALAYAHSSRQLDGVRLTPEPRFIASPVPGGDSFDKYARRAKEWVADWLQPLNERRLDKPPLLESDLTQVIAYREALANSDKVSTNKKDWEEYEIVADWVDRFAPSTVSSSVVITVGAKKERILQELNFPTGTAEAQSDLLETFVETDAIRKALSIDVPLVRGRKGTGKTALFRQLSESGNSPVLKIVAPQSLQAGMYWTWSSDAYKASEEVLEKFGLNWQFFWSFFIAARLHFRHPNGEIPPGGIGEQIPDAPRSEIDVVNALERLAAMPRRELLVAEWLRQLDARAESSTMLLFDGLDSGFGNTSEDRNRRRRATEGLFSFLIDRASQFEKLRLKIVLREDIWRQLRFDNKSHLFGRDASLAWRNNEDFYKVVLSHARKSSAFAELLESDKSISELTKSEPEGWTSEAVTKAWILLIGERMKGSGTTYTQNWVWNRLADANFDRNPRYLLMLMNLVTSWELNENGRSRYERSVIRPRALEQQLPLVSAWALEALREEFDELQPLFEVLKNERTPFSAELLTHVSQDMIALAQEVGLLGVYEERDGSPERYAIPEIYRLALGMKRRGQA